MASASIVYDSLAKDYIGTSKMPQTRTFSSFYSFIVGFDVVYFPIYTLILNKPLKYMYTYY